MWYTEAYIVEDQKDVKVKFVAPETHNQKRRHVVERFSNEAQSRSYTEPTSDKPASLTFQLPSTGGGLVVATGRSGKDGGKDGGEGVGGVDEGGGGEGEDGEGEGGEVEGVGEDGGS